MAQKIANGVLEPHEYHENTSYNRIELLEKLQNFVGGTQKAVKEALFSQNSTKGNY